MRSCGLWFIIGLLLIAAAGAAGLAHPACTARDARDLQHFNSRHYWECAFDAVSLACGSGLLSRDVATYYTPAGRWTLLAIGAAGALLMLAAAARLLRPDVPLRRVLLGWLAIYGFLTLFVFAAGRAFCPTVGLAETAWLVGMSVFSLGAMPQPIDPGTAMMLAFTAWAAALGWPLWLLATPARIRAGVHRKGMLRLLLAYTTFLCLAAGLMAMLESPRSASVAVRSDRADREDARLAQQEPATRYARAIVQVAAASAAGVQTESLEPTDLREPSRALLAMLVLIGTPAGSPGGGIGWPVMLLALASLSRALAGRDEPHPATAPTRTSPFEPSRPPGPAVSPAHDPPAQPAPDSPIRAEASMPASAVAPIPQTPTSADVTVLPTKPPQNSPEWELAASLGARPEPAPSAEVVAARAAGEAARGEAARPPGARPLSELVQDTHARVWENVDLVRQSDALSREAQDLLREIHDAKADSQRIEDEQARLREVQAREAASRRRAGESSSEAPGPPFSAGVSPSRSRRSRGLPAGRAAVACAAWLTILTVATAGGLLLLESRIGSRYQPPPSLADALLDASSAVGGAALSSGLVADVTSRNLVAGLGLGINLYQVGMVGLMLVMLLGRAIPLFLLANVQRDET